VAEGIRIRPRTGVPFPDHAMIVVVDHARPFKPPAALNFSTSKVAALLEA
jgi:hypothetical protein